MSGKLLSFAAAIGFGLALSFASSSAQAAVPAQAPASGAGYVTKVWGGCGPYGHRGPWGGCRRGGQWGGGYGVYGPRPYYRPYRPYYAPRPFYRPYW